VKSVGVGGAIQQKKRPYLADPEEARDAVAHENADGLGHLLEHTLRVALGEMSLFFGGASQSNLLVTETEWHP
jgi:hypothetical protein